MCNDPQHQSTRKPERNEAYLRYLDYNKSSLSRAFSNKTPKK